MGKEYMLLRLEPEIFLKKVTQNYHRIIRMNYVLSKILKRQENLIALSMPVIFSFFLHSFQDVR